MTDKMIFYRLLLWSQATFGPEQQTARLLDHIRKEIAEVEESGGAPDEWVDLVLLAMDGLWRSIKYQVPAHPTNMDEAVHTAMCLIHEKLTINRERDWPDWRTADPNKAIEHVRDTTQGVE